MSRARLIAVALLAVVVLATPAASANLRRDDPRDPITRIAKYIRHLFGMASNDDGGLLIPPKP